MTLSLALWYAFTAGWGASVGVQAHRGRYGPAYASALFVGFCSVFLHFVPMLVAVPTLLACGVSIGERRATQRQLLMSAVVSNRELIRDLKRAELGYQIHRGVAPACAICKAGADQECDSGLHG